MDISVFNEIVTWQSENFPKATDHSKACHLREEVDELIEALEGTDKEAQKQEYADCFLLLYGSAVANGLSYTEINDIIRAKHKINLSRKWGAPDSNGVVKHIEVG